MAKRMTKEYVQGVVAKGYPEVGIFNDPKELKKFYKHLSNEQLDEWISLEGLVEEVKPTDSEQILRMRKCMAILYLHFPKQTKPKKESPYKKYTTEQLVNMAITNEVAFEPVDDMRILRMRAIMALRAAKVIE